MSLKNIELQIALPRTVEQSRNQQIQQNQSNVQRAMAEAEQAQESLQMGQTVMDAKDGARTELHDRKGSNGRETGPRKRVEQEKTPEEAPHPYKGHRLDIKM